MEKTNEQAKGLSTFGYFILIILAIIGLFATVVRFSQGLMVTHLTQNVPWGFWVALYIYCIGLSAGSFLLSTLIYVFGMKKLEAAGRMALFQAFGCMLLAIWLILVDLGHPERFYKVLTSWNYTSILAWESMIYTIYVVVILGEMYFAMRPYFYKKQTGRDLPQDALASGMKWLFILGLIGIPVAIGVHGGTGAIFAVAKARPNWFGGLFPILFLVSALASGGGLLTFLTAVTSKQSKEEKEKLVQSLARLTIGFVALDFLLLSSEILVTFYGGVPREVTGWSLTLFGPFWWVFWFVQLGLGAIAPVLILIGKETGRSVSWLGLAGFLVALGVIGTRMNIVIPPLIQPAFNTLPEAYNHVRFAYGYFPSWNEWLLGFGWMAIALLILALANKVLPLEARKEEI